MFLVNAGLWAESHAWDDSDMRRLLQRSSDWKDLLDREREKDLAGGALLISTGVGSGHC
jgi:hypothetical protein